MSKYKFITLTLFITYFIPCLCIIVETEESLREDIVKLNQGKLKFSDDEIPRYEDELPETNPKNQSEYDFIVIGAGTAGAVVASRLSEMKNYTVLLIEAGSKEYPIMDIPAMAFALELNDEINWKYETEKSDRYCIGLRDSRCYWPRGKVMGGSSVLNLMIATRGNKNDFNYWANLTGDESWSYDEMMKYFKKLESFHVDRVKVEDELHSTSGPVHVTSASYKSEFSKVLLQAGQELGYPEVDYNGRDQIGFNYIQSTINNGERWSTNRAYLYPAKNRENLFLTRKSHVNKILINSDTKLAYGVQFSKADEVIEVKARKEVILSAGAINSPQILMLSGIGPADHLRELNIDVIQDLPVGKNLMDHLSYSGLAFKMNTSRFDNQLDLEDSISDYVKRREGFLTVPGLEIVSYVNVDSLDPFDKDPNIELLIGASNPLQIPLYLDVLGFPEVKKNQILDDNANETSWSVMPILMKPKSHGRVLLRSKDPKDKPKLYANYLSHRDDVETLIKGIRFCQNLSETNTLKKYGSELYKLPLPCESHEFNSDEYWECALRNFATTIYHQSGTCKMGNVNDDTAVVDSQLRMIGVKGLRVVDASIMPKLVSAHPTIPIIAIAEKIADVIKSDYVKIS